MCLQEKHDTHSRDAFFPEFNSTLTVLVHSGTVRPQRTSPPFSVLLPQPRLAYREHGGVPKWYVFVFRSKSGMLCFFFAS